MHNLEPLLSASQAAEILGVSVQTLANVRASKKWPLTYIKIGSRVFYRRRDLEAFIESQAITQHGA